MKLKVFSLLFLLMFSGLAFYLPLFLQAADAPTKTECPPEGNIRVRVYIPSLSGDVKQQGKDDKDKPCYFVESVPHYIRAIYEFGILSGGIVATTVLIIAGFMWLSAAGHAPQITKAKDLLTGALVGYLLLLCAYFILSLVNPALVNLKMPYIETVEEESGEGCCLYYVDNIGETTRCDNVSNSSQCSFCEVKEGYNIKGNECFDDNSSTALSDCSEACLSTIRYFPYYEAGKKCEKPYSGSSEWECVEPEESSTEEEPLGPAE